MAMIKRPGFVVCALLFSAGLEVSASVASADSNPALHTADKVDSGAVSAEIFSELGEETDLESGNEPTSFVGSFRFAQITSLSFAIFFHANLLDSHQLAFSDQSRAPPGF